MKVELVLEDMGAKENGAKMRKTPKYSLTCSKTKMWKKCLWVGRLCWGRNIELGLATLEENMDFLIRRIDQKVP